MKRTFLSILVLFVLVFSGKLYSSEVPREPILCMETGMHTALIGRIGIDAQNQFLVTGSNDKTVRLWELSTGKLIKILRPPIEEGLVGRILSVAITPDGKTIACGGLTGFVWEKSQSIYLFDRESGKLVHRIKDLPGVPIIHLAYSKDGKFLVATLGGGKGIRIYRTRDYSIAGADEDYVDSSGSADFDVDGRLVTASLDGFIRLYGSDFKLIIKKKAPGGKRPSFASFSPDGSSIAVLYRELPELPTVDVLSGKDLSHQYSPDTSGVQRGFFPVCWSSDGKFLYAGKIGGPFFIRKWSDRGRGGFKDLPAGDYEVNQILALKDGGIVFCTYNPAFGVFDADDRKTIYKGPSIAEYRHGDKGFLISHDGNTLQFSYEALGKSPARFSISGRLLELNPPTDKTLSPPITQAGGLNITDWDHKWDPKLNSKVLIKDWSMYLAISPEKNTFLLGTFGSLRLFDKEGKQKWEILPPGPVYSVNVSGNGKVAVAAFGDGTIRWYRMKDGKELLAFFPHRDKKRWVLWTPSGYYDASPGAEELIGWHVNNGREEAADFFPVSRFRGTYYRPDIVAKTLETLDEAEAIKLANKETGINKQEVSVTKMLPPVVSILSPQDRSKVSTTEELPKEPILCMETGMHTAPINGIAIDAQNRFLVTGSNDKTVRLWELFTGRLLKILRPPIGEGRAGMINAVAISPDGKTIACGGLTGLALEKFQSIYLFDRESGKLVQRIKDLPFSTLDLTYSKDSRFLVATIWGKGGGIRVYDTSNYSIVAEDRDYGDSSSRADFDGTGRLATSSFDGFIRLYGNDFKLIIKKKAPGGNKPFSATFSPDGSSIAVSFSDSLNLDVLSGKDLAHQYSPSSSDIAPGGFFPTCWSSDGKFLYAGKGIGPPYIIRKWSIVDKSWWRRGYKDLPAEENSIRRILPLKDGGIVFSTTSPAFGVFAANDKKIVAVSPPVADYRLGHKGFLVSHDGATIQFFYEKSGKSHFRFSTIERSLEINPSPQKDLLPPILQASDPNITDWGGTFNPKLNGRPLKLHKDEFSLSLAISPEKNTFLLGTSTFLNLFDKEGSQKWEVAAPGEVWAANVSANGRVAVAAMGDGTIRWYRMKDGKELLAFFPHIDKKRWVLWTPSGYYDASPGAEELIGWHVNNGREEAADFFPVSRFRGTYYRPDIVAKTLETLDEAEAIKLANKESGKKVEEVPIPVAQIFPPVVSILSPMDGSEVSSKEIEVRFSIRNPSAEPVTTVKVLVDGRPVGRGLAIKEVQKDQEIQATRVPIPEKDSKITIIAENRYAASEPATVNLKWSGKVKEEEFTIKPKLYVLAVGVSKYEDKNLTLQFAAKDAKDFAESLLKQKGGLYRDVVAKVLTDEKATKDEIIDGFDWVSKETTTKDIAIVFLAGHGVNEKGGVYYFLPVNANIDRLRRTGVPFTEIKNTVASLAGKTILFIDTCHAGNVMGARGAATDIMGVVNELASAENGAVVFASSTGKQYSFEDPNWGNGAFTKAVVEGMNGKADYSGKGRITINMLDLYVSERVKELTRGQQTPATAKPQTIPDFPLVLKR